MQSVGQRVKIESIEEEVIRKDERPKLVAKLRGIEQRWVLNATNCELLEDLLGSDEPDDWVGPPFELFNDSWSPPRHAPWADGDADCAPEILIEEWNAFVEIDVPLFRTAN